MQSGDRERASGLDLAGDVGVIERALGLQRDVGILRLAAVTLLERRLHGAQFGGIHLVISLSSSWRSSMPWHKAALTDEHYSVGTRTARPVTFPALRSVSAANAS